MNRFRTFMTLITLVVGGCALSPGPLRDEETILRERVEAFWAAKAKGDWETAETYVDPSLRPGLEPYFKELKGGPHYAEFKSIKIREVKMRGEEADVTTEYSVKWTHPLLTGVPVQDRETRDLWRKSRGVWYLVMERPDPSKIFQRLGPKEGGT